MNERTLKKQFFWTVGVFALLFAAGTILVYLDQDIWAVGCGCAALGWAFRALAWGWVEYRDARKRTKR